MANVLGRGLDALLSEEVSENKKDAARETSVKPLENKPLSLNERPKESVFWIETIKIKPNPEQPRTNFDETKIHALAESIRQYGILQPIVVSKREIDVPTGTQVEYQIIAGERRFRAAGMIGLAQIPAIIRREESEKIKLELALIENLQREDLNSLEKAQAYKRLISDFHLTAREVGMRVGKSREAVTNTVRLLLLPEHVQRALEQNRVTEGQVRPLITIAHSDVDQHTLFSRILSEGLTARDVEREAGKVLARIGPGLHHTKKTGNAVFDAATQSFETKLADSLGTRVSVRRSREGKGKISIEFFSEEEFQNLIARMAALSTSEQSPLDLEHKSNITILPTPTQSIDESSDLQPEEQLLQSEGGAARPDDLSTFTV